MRWDAVLPAQAALKESVGLSFSIKTWLRFKLFVTVPLNIAFAAAQRPLILRERRAAMPAQDRARDPDPATPEATR